MDNSTIQCYNYIDIKTNILKKYVIKIKTAFFGRHQNDSETCPHENGYVSYECQYDVTDIIKNGCKSDSEYCNYSSSNEDEGCESKNECFVSADIFKLKDPCSDIFKYMEIEYYCGESSEIATNEAGDYLVENNGRLITDISKYNEQNLCILYECDNDGNCQMKDITGYVVFKSDGDGILLKCTNGNCSKVNSPKTSYYLNSGDERSSHPLIYCSENEYECSTVTASPNGYYIHGGSNGLSNALINCDSGCKIDNTITVEDSTYRYYLNNGNDKESKRLIQCSNSSCSTISASKGYYLNSGKILIKCNEVNSCDIPSEISVSNGSFKYFINNGEDKDNETKKLLIECSSSSCSTKEASNNDGYYLHGDSTNLSKALIHCTSISNCDGNPIDVNVNVNNYIYYINNGSDNTTNKLIECSKSENKCLTKIAASTYGYYLHGGSTNLSKALIHCIDSNNCENPFDKNVSFKENESFIYYINNGSDNDTNKLIEYSKSENNCLTRIAASTDGYYLHGGSDNLSKALIHCTDSNNCENPFDKNVSFEENESFIYYINNGSDNDINKLIECSKSENKCLTKIAVSTGYYINPDNTALACIKDQGCEEVTKDNYMTNSCEDIYLGKIMNQSGDVFLCSSVDIDKSKSGVYITSVNNDSFPGTPKGVKFLEYNNVRNTILKVEGNDKCTEDRQIIFKNDTYYYCVSVIVHETYENGEEIPNEKLTGYESVSISMNSIGSSFVMNFGKDGESEYKVVNIEENRKITMDYGKMQKITDK